MREIHAQTIAGLPPRAESALHPNRFRIFASGGILALIEAWEQLQSVIAIDGSALLLIEISRRETVCDFTRSPIREVRAEKDL